MTRGRLLLRFLPAMAPLLLAVPALWIASRAMVEQRKASVGRELEAVARTGAASVDGALFASLFVPPGGTEPAAYEAWMRAAPSREGFAALREQLRAVIEANSALGFTQDNVYAFAVDPASSTEVRWAVMTHDVPFSGEGYRTRPEMRAVISGVASGAHTDVYRSTASHLDWVSAYAPIRDPGGRVVGILEVAWQVEKLLAETRAAARNALVAFAGVVLVAAVAAAFMAYLSLGLERRTLELGKTLAELHAAQESLVRSEKLAAVGQLAASVAHELRNPLAAIRNAATFVSRKLGSSQQDPRVVQFLGIIDSEVGVCTRITTDLLDFARERRPVPQLCPLRELVDEAIGIVEAGPVVVVNHVPGDLPPLWADPGQLRQVLANLVQNGIEAIPPDRTGSVVVSAGGGGDARWRIEVRDDGAGIPAESLRTIFEPLFTTKTKGTGLGLAIVAGLVKANGGTIDVESERDRGARFVVTLPPNPVLVKEPGRAVGGLTGLASTGVVM